MSRALPRSQLICSSGKDKYTFDSERAEPPVRPPEPRDRPEPRLVARQTVVSRLELPQPTRDAQGRFGNPWPTEPWSAFGSILHLSFKGPKTDRHELERALPLATPRWDEHVGDGLAVTWLGHSTCLVSLDGVTLLTDPHFSARASPSPLIGPKRLRPAPASVHALPHVHAVLISHAHYDHLDLASVSALNARFGRDARWFAPLGVGTWLARAGVQDVVELAWWAEAALPERQDVSFVLTPAKHASRRSLTDAGRALWGSWAVLGPRRRFFFGGDSGFCDVFALIGRLYGPFDLAALPIGAYHPREQMRDLHVEPREAVRMHLELGARFSVGVHWGTFVLSGEHPLEPPKKLREALRELRVDATRFQTLALGETRVLGPDERFH